MRAIDIIVNKRDGKELSKEEIEAFITGYTRGDIPDYQAAAWLMAVFLKGMNPRETTDLTLAMAHSGEVLDLSRVLHWVVDKHSTGGVGDKTTLVVEPLVAACGLPMAKMSGRGLDFTGGTLDKMESIPGFRVALSREEFLEQVERVGLVLAGQSAELAPADGKLYALRDATGTVPSIPLIASSIMSKKIAAGAQAVLLDVKVGSGAFMADLPSARELAKLMVDIGRGSGLRVVALLSDMEQPLGHAVGNALEVREAIDTLHGQGPRDFQQHCLVLAGHLLVLGDVVSTVEQGMQRAEEALANGSGWEKFRQMVAAQGGDVRYVDDPELLPKAKWVRDVSAPRSGYLRAIDAKGVGVAALHLGAGREKKEDPVDHAVGVVMHHKVGDALREGEALATVHANREEDVAPAVEAILDAHTWSDEPVPARPLFFGVID